MIVLLLTNNEEIIIRLLRVVVKTRVRIQDTLQMPPNIKNKCISYRIGIYISNFLDGQLFISG